MVKVYLTEFSSSGCKNSTVQTFHKNVRHQIMQICSSGCHQERGSWEDQADEGDRPCRDRGRAEIRSAGGSESDVSDGSDMSSSSSLSKQHVARSLTEASPAELLHALWC